MDTKKLDEYDLHKLQDAKRLVGEVYEHNYGASCHRQAVARLETIYDKLDSLLLLHEED